MSSAAPATSAVADAITEATTADPRIADLLFDVNQHWMIYAGSLVFFMQAGFSLLEAGSVSAKNSTNVLFKNLLVGIMYDIWLLIVASSESTDNRKIHWLHVPYTNSAIH